jgi:hypothetical protein
MSRKAIFEYSKYPGFVTYLLTHSIDDSSSSLQEPKRST